VTEQLVERWWNGSWGSMTRKEVRLYRSPQGWRVETDRGGHILSRAFATEEEAREIVDLAPRTPGEWSRLA
jgi:hypothetical protein